MRLLVIISNHIFKPEWCDNIKSIHNHIKLDDIEIDYCGISNQDDFNVFEHIITFKYKIINTKYQLSKICDFISLYKSQLNYDWFMKIRPDILLLDNIQFNKLSDISINARARVYNGPSIIQYGMSINGKGCWENIGDCSYDTYEHDIILDDALYIFHKNVVELNAFEIMKPHTQLYEREYDHKVKFNERNIKLNVIGINLCLTKYNAYSGNINMPPILFNQQHNVTEIEDISETQTKIPIQTTIINTSHPNSKRRKPQIFRRYF